MCSVGRNTCPDLHPFSYDYGRHCCNSPIQKLWLLKILYFNKSLRNRTGLFDGISRKSTTEIKKISESWGLINEYSRDSQNENSRFRGCIELQDYKNSES